MPGFLLENPGVTLMDVNTEIRRRFHVEGETVTSLASSFNLSHPTSASLLRRLKNPFISVKINPIRS